MSKQVEEGKLSQFRPAEHNSNKHTVKGLKALDASLEEDGYVAPMTATADGEILDGSARLERAFEKFGDKAIIVKHDGKTPVVMVREDIPNADDPTARRIHYRANMVHWLDFSLDPSVVMADMEAGFDFEGLGVNLEELGEMLEGGVQELLNNHGETPSLDALENQYGEPQDRDFWPFIKVQVSPETKSRWDELIEMIKGDDEAVKVERLLEAVDETVLGSL